ncbi:hypothetical protein T4B_1705 [Trichinella pseudospiralis]|uniref:Secreted protein n=1 Tax=Trichinella pseudospiralis TaxID=6337 RepID=A0A0V1IFW5_TRIPS|nr:hypothetical protein T4B_1705 [Trichinella pseudospiralis]
MFFCLFAIFSSSLTIFLPLSTSVVNVVDLSPWRQSVKHLDISVCPRRVDAWALERPSYSLTVTTPSACCSIDARACHAVRTFRYVQNPIIFIHLNNYSMTTNVCMHAPALIAKKTNHFPICLLDDRQPAGGILFFFLSSFGLLLHRSKIANSQCVATNLSKKLLTVEV